MNQRSLKPNTAHHPIHPATFLLLLLVLAVLLRPLPLPEATTHLKPPNSSPVTLQTVPKKLPTKRHDQKDYSLVDFQKNTTKRLKKLAGDTPLAVSLIVVSAGDIPALLDFNGDEPCTAASTYKIYAVSSIMREIEKGNLSDSDYIYGLTVPECMQETIVYSENDCIEAWLFDDNFSTVKKAVSRWGLENTSFVPYDIETTANDLTFFVASLASGEVLNKKHQKTLLTWMGEQIWRDGIPAGWGDDSIIANKPGFLDEVHNDVALITTTQPKHGKTELALAVMTGTGDFELTSKATRIVFEELLLFQNSQIQNLL